MTALFGKKTVWLVICLVGILQSSASAAVIAVSDFESGLDGWTAVGDGTISHQSSGGNPGGYFRSDDGTTGVNTDAYAPAKFLGDWSSYDGNGSISADFNVIFTNYNITEGMNFHISGPGGAASRLFAVSEGPFEGVWTTYMLPILESEWGVTSGTWTSLLANVTVLRIDMEHVIGHEETGLDNVILQADPVPEPATMLLLGTGLAGLVGTRIKRKKQ